LAGAGGQEAGNQRKLLSWAKQFDRLGPHGHAKCAQQMVDLIESDTKEGEAITDPGLARVQIMTVHAAKGLEFPVVILPHCETTPLALNDHWMSVKRDSDWQISCRVADDGSSVLQRHKPAMMAQMAAQHIQEEDAEMQRLFYVACTRARDALLILSEDTTNGKVKRNCRQYLEGFDPTGTCFERLMMPDVMDPTPRPPTPAAPSFNTMPAWSAYSAQQSIEIAPSSLDLFSSDPATWYQRHWLGIPDLDALISERPTHYGNIMGDVIHMCMEDPIQPSEATILSRWATMARSAGASQSEIDSQDSRVVRHVQNAWQLPELQRRLSAKGHAEPGFQIRCGAVILKGQIDRMWWDENTDEWVILDWKSGKLSVDEIEVKASKHRQQLLAYAWAATQISTARGLKPVLRTELYFSEISHLEVLKPFSQDELEGLTAQLKRVERYVEDALS